MKSLEERHFDLPAPTLDAVLHYLSVAREVSKSSNLSGVNDRWFMRQLRSEVQRRLGESRPSLAIKNGYALAERVMAYHHRQMSGDKSVARKIAKTIKQLRRQVERKAVGELYLATAEQFWAHYQQLTAVDLFTRDGRPVGRAERAAQKVIAELPRQTPRARREDVGRILGELKSMAKAISDEGRKERG